MKRTEISFQETLKVFPTSTYPRQLPDFTDYVLYMLLLFQFHTNEITQWVLLSLTDWILKAKKMRSEWFKLTVWWLGNPCWVHGHGLLSHPEEPLQLEGCVYHDDWSFPLQTGGDRVPGSADPVAGDGIWWVSRTELSHLGTNVKIAKLISQE